MVFQLLIKGSTHSEQQANYLLVVHGLHHSGLALPQHLLLLLLVGGRLGEADLKLRPAEVATVELLKTRGGISKQIRWHCQTFLTIF